MLSFQVPQRLFHDEEQAQQAILTQREDQETLSGRQFDLVSSRIDVYALGKRCLPPRFHFIGIIEPFQFRGAGNSHSKRRTKRHASRWCFEC